MALHPRPAATIGALLVSVCLAFPLTGCKEEKAAISDVRPVRAIQIAAGALRETQSLTGQVAARNTVNASFRIGGKLMERAVFVGDAVRGGQVLARLDPKPLADALAAADADVATAQALLDQVEKTETRAATLSKVGAMSQSDHDEAVRQLRSARAQLAAALARRHTAKEQLGYATLVADGDGVVAETGAEPSETVAAGQMVVRLAQHLNKDALFDVPEAAIRRGLAPGQEIGVRLAADPSVEARALMREISPQADAATRTFPAKATLVDPPAAMLLGATVVGSFSFPSDAAFRVPASALTMDGGAPAVWLVDPAAMTVAARRIDVARYETDWVVVAAGLAPGDLVVTAGVQALHRGQKVRLLDQRP